MGAGCKILRLQSGPSPRQEFTVTPGWPHTAVITVTSATGSREIRIDFGCGQHGLLSCIKLGWVLILRAVSFTVRMPTQAPPLLLLSNVAASAVPAQGIADNLNAYFANVRTGHLGKNDELVHGNKLHLWRRAQTGDFPLDLNEYGLFES